MAARLADQVASLVASTPLPSSGGAACAPASTGAQVVFAQMIATLAQAGPRPKTTAAALPKITVQPAGQQAPSAGQTLPKAPHQSGSAAALLPKITALPAGQQAPSASQTLTKARHQSGSAAAPLPKITAPPAGQQAPSPDQTLTKAPHQSGSAAASPSQRSVRAPRSAGRDAPQTGQAPDVAPPNPNPLADAAAATAPPIVASIPSQSIVTGGVDNDPREAAVGSTAVLPSGRAEPAAAAATPPAAATASDIRSAAPLAPPDSTPSGAPPQASLPSPAIAATAAVVSVTPATPLTTTLAAPPVARTTTPAPPPATTPAAQIAPTLISVTQSTSGTHRITIRLDPPELGTVQIRVEHPADAPMQVQINVQRPETLTLLMRDQPHLQHALDQAGVPAEGRTLSFQLGPQDQRGTSGDPGSGQGRRAPTPAARQMQDDPDDPGDPTAGTTRWSRVALDITA